MQIILCGNPSVLSDHLSTLNVRTGTVEAEYGDIAVEGSEFTLAHHGPRSGNPAPCLTEAGSLPVVDVIGVSHFDHDTVMGIGAAMGRNYPRPFAELAALADVEGPHVARESLAWDVYAPSENVSLHYRWGEALDAMWAWEEANKVWPDRDGKVDDITEQIEEYLDVIDKILAGDDDLIIAGREWRAAEVELEKSSFRRSELGGSLLVRESEEFVNHLYEHDGKMADCVVTLNPKVGEVTLSFREPSAFTNPVFEDNVALYFVQKAYGPEAGGGAGCAGGPRNAGYTMAEVNKVVELIRPYF